MTRRHKKRGVRPPSSSRARATPSLWRQPRQSRPLAKSPASVVPPNASMLSSNNRQLPMHSAAPSAKHTTQGLRGEACAILINTEAQRGIEDYQISSPTA